MNSKDSLRLFEMSTDQKLLELYRVFPKCINYLYDLRDLISITFTEEKLSAVKSVLVYLGDTTGILSFSVMRIGIYSIEWDPKAEDKEYEVSFTPDWYLEQMDDQHQVWVAPARFRVDADCITNIVVPFMNSLGLNKEEIPLLINMFPKFVSYVMENDFTVEDD